MSVPRFTHLATKALAKARPVVAAAAPSAESRARSIAAIEGAIKAKLQRRVRVRWTAGLIAVASVAAAALVTLSTERASVNAPAAVAASSAFPPAPSLLAPSAIEIVARAAGDHASIESAGDRSVASGQTMARGSRLVTGAGGHATLTFSTGTELTLDDAGDLTLVEEGLTQIVALGGGRLRAQVAKLGASQRFMVRTADAEIEVRGTVFRVRSAASDPGCGGGSPTRVAVEEGTVVVRHAGKEAILHAGDAWPLGCAAPNTLSAHGATANGDLGTTPLAPAAPAPVTVSAAASSTLAEQNDSFASAVAAKTAGDASTAIARFDAFLAKYPGSPLAESATVQRMHLLAAHDSKRARGAAEAYLAAYPNGLARAEARTILDAADLDVNAPRAGERPDTK